MLVAPNNEIQQGSTPTGVPVMAAAAQPAPEAAPAAGETTPQSTPFDRFNRSLPGQAARAKSSEAKEPEEEPLWRKWFAKLRQIIGFETS
jgi:hypothetical protein